MQNCFPKENSIFLLFSVQYFFFPRQTSPIALEGDYYYNSCLLFFSTIYLQFPNS